MKIVKNLKKSKKIEKKNISMSTGTFSNENGLCCLSISRVSQKITIFGDLPHRIWFFTLQKSAQFWNLSKSIKIF